MKKNEKDRKHISNGLKPNKLTAILGGVIALLLVGIVLLMIFIPEEAPVPTEPTASETASPETSELPTYPTELVTEPVPTIEIVGETAPVEMLPEMAELYEKNSDIGGWLTIADTKIDYPVMFTPEKPSKYLYTTFEGKFKYRGELYVGRECTFEPETQVILIHGHNMTDGSMFNNLLNYKSKAFWESHPTISFSTLYEERTYEIFAAFRDQIYDATEDVFRYYKFINPITEEEFNEGIAYFKDKTTYDMGVDVQFGDKLLMLSTCDRTITDGRFVVVAKLVTDDQTAESTEAAQ